MTDMIEVKTAELVGPALDWAVAQAIGADQVEFGVVGSAAFIACIHSGIWERNWRPSASWAQGGPLIDKHRMSFWGGENYVYAVCAGGEGYGPTHLVAACRAIVAASLGDTVSVPAALLASQP